MNEETQTLSQQNESDTLLGGEEPEAGVVPEEAPQETSAAKQDRQDSEQSAAEEVKGAPEKYTFTYPEGKEYDKEVIASFSEACKAADLSQEKAQAFLDTMAPKLAEQQMKQIEQLRTEWADQAANDTEFGGVKLAENLSTAKKALTEFGSRELRDLLNETGLGNHPEVIRFFYRAGKAVAEDSFVAGNKSDGGVKDPAKILYPDMK